MLTRARKIEIEMAVVELLEEYGFGSYPVHIGDLLPALQIDQVPYSSLDDAEKALANFASQDRAFSVTSRDYMRTQVVFNDTRGSYFWRSRFSGGHEIGHIWLEHGEDTPERESEADYFSGYLLAPHPLIMLTMKNPKVAEVSELFGVSRYCASCAIDQASARWDEGTPLRPHEKWLTKNAK